MAESQDKAPVGHLEAPTHQQSNGRSLGLVGTCVQYLKDRVPTLKPPMRKAPNPFQALLLLNRQQWLFFSVCSDQPLYYYYPCTNELYQVAFLGWTLDALDFFTVSLTTSQLAAEFDKEISDITWGITLVLMLRSVGAITFGIASDRWGRKWPFIVNNLLFIALEIGTGFTQTYKQFLAVRALFGIAMGGLYGNAAATALEDCPKEARGIISGLLQQGYAFGYLLATAFARALVDTTSHGWRPFYWFAGCLPVLAIAFRLCLPETNAYRERQALRAELPGNVTSTFLSEGKVALKKHWLLLVYMVLLMAGFNFMVRTLTQLNFHEASTYKTKTVPRIPRSLPNPNRAPIWLLPGRCHSNPSRRKSRRPNRWHNLRLGLPNLRPPLLDYYN